LKRGSKWFRRKPQGEEIQREMLLYIGLTHFIKWIFSHAQFPHERNRELNEGERQRVKARNDGGNEVDSHQLFEESTGVVISSLFF
jgi:hypothetical protein